MTSNFVRRFSVAALLVVAAATRAEAQVTYDFSVALTGVAGGSSGTWSGFVVFDWLTSGGSGTGAASSFVTTAQPANIATPAQGWDATLWTYIGANSFTVTSGTITAFQFGAVSTPDDFVLCLNGGSQFLLSNSGYQCPTSYHRVGVINSARGENRDGLQGVSFREKTATVPEPTSLALLSVGLVGLASAARRRRS